MSAVAWFGSTQQTTFKFYVAGVLTDPTVSMVAKVQANPPNGVETVYTYGVDAVLTKLATGTYQLLTTNNVNGPWMARGIGTGFAGDNAAVGVVEVPWSVKPSALSSP